MLFILISCVLVLTFSCVALMLYRYKTAPKPRLSFQEVGKLFISGVLAFISDTIGVGSFAVNVALSKLLGTFKDEELPAVNNGAQVIPGAISSIYFMQAINVDMTMLTVLVAATCVGGLLGGFVMTKLSQQSIRMAMMGCFLLIILLLLAEKLGLMPAGGHVETLTSYKLVLGFFGLLICGALTTAGIGLFVLVQSVLFLLNVSPIVAFPIMMTAGAMQQPLSTMVFVYQNKVPLKRVFVLSLSGCVGVLITLPLFKGMSVSVLHTLLLGILIYNLIAVSRTYFTTRQANLAQSIPLQDTQELAS